MNYLIHAKEIQGDFTSRMEAMYMHDEWGIEVGYKTLPLWYVDMRKELLSYQQLASLDCNNELFIASQGKVVINCCSSGSTRTEVITNRTCCPPGSTYRNSDGLCVATDGTTSAGLPCPCCPTGYVYNQGTGNCQGVGTGDIKVPINCPEVCVDGVGNSTPLLPCLELEPATTLLSAPVGSAQEYGYTWCRPKPVPVVVTRTITTGPTVTIFQFTVGDISGPTIGTTTFTPYIGGVAYLIGKTTIEVAQLMVLTLGTDYTFDTTTGKITLLLGRIFNLGEVYTITAF